MPIPEAIRTAVPVILAAATTVAFDRVAARRGLDPPGFADPVRRLGAATILALGLWLGVFYPLSTLGIERTVDLDSLPTWQLFALHALFVSTIAAWFTFGFAGRGGRLLEQIGLVAARPGREVAVGLAAGVVAWFVVVLVVIAVALVVAAFGGENALPKEPPAVIPWLAGRPLLLRLGLAASAGLVEESFFRGFLQPRIGILASTALFALPHLSYDQPFFLVGITALSILYGLLTKWRQSIWAAVIAHTLFDAVQLVIVIPAVLKYFFAGSS